MRNNEGRNFSFLFIDTKMLTGHMFLIFFLNFIT